MLLHVPLIFHGPVAFLGFFPLLVTLTCSVEGILEYLVSDYAVFDSDGAGSLSKNSQKYLRCYFS